jgi:hypothetical protein
MKLVRSRVDIGMCLMVTGSGVSNTAPERIWRLRFLAPWGVISPRTGLTALRVLQSRPVEAVG